MVLGSEGQIGSHLTGFLRESGHEVVAHDINTIDLRYGWDSQAVDFVFFLAFDVGGAKYLAQHQHSFGFIDTNMLLMHNVFSHLRRSGTPFIFASSQMSNMVHSPYGMLKRVGEHYAESLGGVSVRFWNVYGVERDPQKFHVITDFLRLAETGRISMLTDGEEKRQFLHVEDSSRALTLLAERFGSLDRSVYDVTSFKWSTIKEVAEIVASLYPGTVVVPGAGKDDSQFLNEPNTEIRKIWQPRVPLPEGIERMKEEMNTRS